MEFGACGTDFALLWGNLEVLAAPWDVKAGSPVLELLGKGVQDGGRHTNPQACHAKHPLPPKHRCHIIWGFCLADIPTGAPASHSITAQADGPGDPGST